MVASARAAVPTVGDNAVAMQLANSAKNTAVALIELKSAAAKVSFLVMVIVAKPKSENTVRSHISESACQEN